MGVRRWRELVIGKNREVLFDRPKPTVSSSANGRRRIPDSHLYRVTNTRCNIGTVISPDDGHIVA
jgi:hypothetical protein